jgi:hypothetical protein
MPFGGFRFDSGVTNSGVDLFPEIAEPQVLDDDASKNIVRKIRGKELYPCERVKFCDLDSNKAGLTKKRQHINRLESRRFP